MKNKIIPINDSMARTYDQYGKKIVVTANGPMYKDEYTHAEVTSDMKTIVRLLNKEPEVTVEELKEEVKPAIKRTRKKKES